jgi:hypothetical protein
MSISARPRWSFRSAQLPALVLLGVAVAWGLFRTLHVLHIHWTLGAEHNHDLSAHDLYTYYSIWFVLWHRDCADIALRESLYLPHTWFAFTPLFILGWSAAKILMFLINTAAVFYIWWRLADLTGLHGLRRWLLLAFFWCWSAPANVIGLGNLALVCLAAALAAYPFSSSTSGVYLALSAMKQSVVFPLYFHLLLKRSRILIVPFAIFALCGLAALWWAHLGFIEGLALPKYWADQVGAWTAIDHTCLRRVLVLFIHNAFAVSVVMWVIWFALFGMTARWIKDPISQLAALLLLALLPTYHYAYDMILALPTLAVLMKRCRLVWPALMTLALACDPLRQLGLVLPAGPFREMAFTLQSPYLPVLILVLLGGLLYLEVSPSKSSFAISGGQASPGPAPTVPPSSSAGSLGQA